MHSRRPPLRPRHAATHQKRSPRATVAFLPHNPLFRIPNIERASPSPKVSCRPHTRRASHIDRPARNTLAGPELRASAATILAACRKRPCISGAVRDLPRQRALLPGVDRVPPPRRGRAVLPVRQPQRGRPPRGAGAIHRERPGRAPRVADCFPASSKPTTTASSAIARMRAGSRSSTRTSSCSRPPDAPCAEILRDFEEHPAVVVNSLTFGTSGHLTPQPGLLIENYVRRTDRLQRMRIVKSIVDPRRSGR